MSFKRQIPNIITLGNLFCGTVAAIFAIQGDFVMTALFVALGIIFDFFDGFVARILNVQAELGKQMDSLADMVTSGVVPGLVMFQLLKKAVNNNAFETYNETTGVEGTFFLPYVGLLLTVFACYRLAKFNLDERQSDSFIGLPTPSMCLFVVSLPLILDFAEYSFFVDLVHNKFFLILITLLLSFLMISELPLFSLKFKNYGFKDNIIKYLFLIVCVLLLIFLKFVALPMAILAYILFSVFENFNVKK